MKKIRRIIMSVLCICLTLLFCFNGSMDTYATDQTDVDEARREADETKKKITDITSRLTDVEGQMEQVQAAVDELNEQLESISANMVYYQGLISDKQAEITTKNEEITSKQLDIEAKNGELTQAQKDEKDQYDAMALRIQYMYEQGDESVLDMLFSSKDISDLLGRAEYFSSITAYDRQQLQVIKDTEDKIALLLTELQNDKAALESEKAELESEKAELDEYEAELEDQQNTVNEALAAQQAALDSLASQKEYMEQQVAEEQAKYEAQQAQAAKLQALWEEEQKQLAANGENADEANQKKLDEIGLNGGFTWPLPGYNTITSRFGPRISPISGMNLGNHCGVDISGAGVFGKPIVAAYAGTVISADVYRGDRNAQVWGNSVQINHGSGVVTLYAHMSQIAVSVGQTVNAGDVIGYVGSTGASTGPHLHLGLLLKGQFVDPLNYFTVP